MLMDLYTIAKEVFGNNLAIFLYGFGLGIFVAYKFNISKMKPSDNTGDFYCRFYKKTRFEVYIVKNKSKFFCENLEIKKRFLSKQFNCKTLNTPCPYAKHYD